MATLTLEDAEETLRRLGEKNAEVVAIDRQVTELTARRKTLGDEIEKMRTHAADAWLVVAASRKK